LNGRLCARQYPGFLLRIGDRPTKFDEFTRRSEVLVAAYEIGFVVDVASDF
jgi:hypothetical protein